MACNNFADGVRVSIGVMEERDCEVKPVAAVTPVDVTIDKTAAGPNEAELVVAGSWLDDQHVLPGHWIRIVSTDAPATNSGLFVVVELDELDPTRLTIHDPDDAIVDELTPVTAPTVQVVYEGTRATARNINYERDEIVSQEVRADRQIVDVRGGFEQVTGQLGFEASLISYDTLLGGALSGEWTEITIDTPGALTLTPGAADSDVATLTRATGDWEADGVRVGTVLLLSGSGTEANNGLKVVLEVTDATNVVIGDPGNLIAAGDDPTTVTAPGRYMDAGTTKRTYRITRSFNDIGQYQIFKGVTINSMSMSLSPGDPVGGTFDFLGMSSQALTGTPDGEETPLPTTGFLSSFDGVLYEGGDYNDVITSMEFTLENNRQLTPVVGKTTSPGVFEGQCIVTGSISAMFKGGPLFNKFYNEERTDISVIMYDANDPNGFMAVTFHRVKYTGATMDPPSEGAVVMDMPFRALGKAVNTGDGNSVTTNITMQVYNTVADQRAYPLL